MHIHEQLLGGKSLPLQVANILIASLVLCLLCRYYVHWHTLSGNISPHLHQNGQSQVVRQKAGWKLVSQEHTQTIWFVSHAIDKGKVPVRWSDVSNYTAHTDSR